MTVTGIYDGEGSDAIGAALEYAAGTPKALRDLVGSEYFDSLESARKAASLRHRASGARR